MIIQALQISGAYLLKPELIEDERGHFFRGFCQKELKSKGIQLDAFVQVNRSFNKKKGTFRGLHFQRPPFAEEKVITCLSGAVADVIVDLRKDSLTFLYHEIVDLSSANKISLLVPKGCAHGFITLTDNTELLYMHTNYYVPNSESACSVMDPSLKITLPVTIEEISERDQSHIFLDRNFKGIEL
jgi:dTDP-4-dehydrorhamnose 3,5-epimerase